MPQNTAYRARVGAVHHTDPNCPIGRQIPAELLVEGAGGLPLCPTCKLRSQARPPSGPFAAAERSEDAEGSDPDDVGLDRHPERSDSSSRIGLKPAPYTAPPPAPAGGPDSL